VLQVATYLILNVSKNQAVGRAANELGYPPKSDTCSSTFTDCV